MNSRHSSNNAYRGLFAASASDRETLSEEAFHRMVSIERRRTERSRKMFLLMLLDMGEPVAANGNKPSLRTVLSTLSRMLRETDVSGWYKEDSVVGVMFTEITLENESSIPANLMTRVTHTLKNNLSPHQFHQIGISFHLLPEASHGVSATIPAAMYRGVSTARETSL